ncbi:MAG: NAD(P)-dependent oxidoreductase [Verrucomicrobia bacterium]|nr:NAD(P)-dependent oxidoreductase [Verrucomicrobiota bacterium]
MNPDSQECALVTGGCGFIGTWVIRELLSRRLRVVALDTGGRPARWERLLGADAAKVPLVSGSLLDRHLLARLFSQYSVTRVIHLAALLTPACQGDPFEGCRVNLLGSVALWEQARASAAQVKGFSYASSVAVFGDEPDNLASKAAEGHAPITFYGAFKRAMELIADQYWRHFQVASLGIRPHVAYGPERDTGLTAGTSLAARAAARGEDFHIGYTGRVGYDYVEDVARAFVQGSMETPRGADVVDLAGETASVDEVVAAIADYAPRGAAGLSFGGALIPAHAHPAPRFISTIYPDWSTTRLRDGIRRTMEFYRERGQV